MKSEFKAGDKVVCTESSDALVSTGKEYYLEKGEAGNLLLRVSINCLYAFNDCGDGTGRTNAGNAKFKKVEAKKVEATKFKPGDLVFEVFEVSGIRLSKLVDGGLGDANYPIATKSKTYVGTGKLLNDYKLPSIFHATPEKRQALVALYGEDAVPKLPLSPQEITLKLLENQKYQLCKVSNHSTQWDFNNVLKAVIHIGVFNEFIDSNGASWTYGIPVDNNGNEITEIEPC